MLVSRRQMLRGATGLGLAAATGTLLPSCGWGGGRDNEESGPAPDAPLETTDPVDSVRFYALRLKEAGIIDATPEQILERGTDFRYFEQLKRELKEA